MAKELNEPTFTTLKVDKKLRFDLHTAVAWIIWAALLTYAYFNPNDQFNTYAIWLTTGTLGYTTKRLIQKKKEFSGTP